jgi:DUF1680 family protein
MRLFKYSFSLVAFLIVVATTESAVAQLSTFDLSTVRLQDSPFLKAQQTDLQYILSLDVDRLLVPFRRDAGITTEVESYGNWENTGLDGHIGGHYLSALSNMYAATGNDEIKRRLDYMVKTLAECQEKNGTGYVGGIPNGKAIWEDIRIGKIESDNFSLNRRWVPLYNIHKLYAGLYDAAVIGRNAQAKDVFIRLCDWFVALTSNLTDDQIQLMLKSEHGGLNEVFAQATELTGDQKYLVLGKKLSHRAILNPLLQGADQLTGLHANTQIPKVIGFKRIADVTHDKAWSDAADFFWNTVVSHRTVSIGGNSVREHFHPATDFSSMIESNQGPETCNTYNMLKLTKALFLSKPEAKYMDYYERAIYNHILSSQHPKGGFVYFTPMRPRHYRVYSSVNESFWCCVGSGLENHTKYGELIYAHEGRNLYVNLFIPSTLEWKEQKVRIKQETMFPFTEETRLTVNTEKKSKFRISLRRPHWAGDKSFQISINGKLLKIDSQPGSYVSLDRVWKDGDVITIKLPMRTVIEQLPDSSSWASFVHGPIVLAAATDSTDLKGLRSDGSRMGHVAEGKFYPLEEAPVIVTNDKNWITEVRAIPGKSLTFSLPSSVYPAKYSGLQLVPFFLVHDRRYMIYWPTATATELEKMKILMATKSRAREELKLRTVDEVTPGEQQPEVEHNFDGKGTEAGSSNGESWRLAREWMSYELTRDKTAELLLSVSYGREVKNKKFVVTLNNKELSESSQVTGDGETVLIEYKIPVEILASGNDTKLLLKFTAVPGSDTGRIFSIALLRP